MFKMRHSILAVGMATAVVAQTQGFYAIDLPEENEQIPACTTYDIKWSRGSNSSLDGTVNFGLIGGVDSNHLVPIGETFGSADGSAGTYSWDVPCDAGSEAIYGLQIFLASDHSIYQYSKPFHIVATEDSDKNNTTTTSDTGTPTQPASTSDVNTKEATQSPSAVTTAESPETTVELSNNATLSSTSTTTTDASETTSTSDLTETNGAYHAVSCRFAFLAAAAAAIFM